MAFDLQAHRGGAGLWRENSLTAFGNALALGVSTLELDVHVAQDGVPVVRHDRILEDGEFIAWLVSEETGLPTLQQVIDLIDDRHADEVRLNIETKFDVVHEDEDFPRERFADAVVAVLEANAFLARASVQSFDWAVLDLVRARAAEVALNVLTNTNYLEVGLPGASPWMAGVDVDLYGGDVVRAAAGRGYAALSPAHTLVTEEMVDEAHAASLQVIPYTVDEPSVMGSLVDLGVDGLITNRPDVLREVMADRRIPLPRAYPAPD